MKKKLNKFDFLAINRAINQNYNASSGYFSFCIRNITHGEELKLNRKEGKK